ncbi:MAG: tetratricopeptide repeat protein [Candidatus Paceibacterota bacterium]|jgi:tetratricopeptide (TPR) repeat protein
MEEGEKIKVKSVVPFGNAAFFEKIGFSLVLIGMFLVPIFFIPSISFPFQFSKVLLFTLTTLLALVCFILARLKEGAIQLPEKFFLAGAFLLVLTNFLVAIFSGNVAQSMAGQGFEVATAVSIFTMVALLVVTAALFQSREKIFLSYSAFFLGALILFVFQLIHFIFPNWLTFGGIFSGNTASLIGRFNDLGIIFGAVALLSLATTELLVISKFFRICLYAVSVLAMVVLMAVNFSVVWWAVASFTLILFVYLWAVRRTAIASPIEDQLAENASLPKHQISYAALVVLIVASIFIADSFIQSKPIGSRIANTLNITQFEVRPSWSATADISLKSLASNPVFGVGQNRFTYEWLKHKPSSINSTIFWNTDFNFGIGLIPSMAVTTGALGLLSWLVFLGLFLFVGFRAIFFTNGDVFNRYLTVSSFAVAAYLWVFSIFYIPSAVVFALTFFFSGLFLASLYQDKNFKSRGWEFVFSDSPKKSFIATLVLVILLVVAVTIGAVLVRKFTAFTNLQKALIAFNTKGDIAATEAGLKRAISLSEMDIYNRFLAELYLVKINNLFSRSAADLNTDEAKAEFQTSFGEAIKYSKRAIELNNGDYQNWMEAGQVYTTVVSSKIAGAYENALLNYNKALELNPQSPLIHLTLARLDLANSDNKKARESIEKALEMKPDYTDAIFLLAQIDAAEGNLTEAIKSVEKIAQIAPDDPTVFFQLGLLQYNNKNYNKTVEALERAVTLSPDYANARYFLGLSYYQIGKNDEAVQQFVEIQKTNSDNEEVALILKNLKAGKSPFTDAQPPVDNKPESRSKPPIEEPTPAE